MKGKSEAIEPFSPEEQVIITVAKEFFWFFLQKVFLKSFEGETYIAHDGTQKPFEFSKCHIEWAILFQLNPRLCLMAPRGHLKSTIIQAYIMWQMFRTSPGEVRDIMYFSYKAELAVEQVEKLLRFIRDNPYCRFWRDMKPQSTTMLDYMIDFGEGTLGEATLKGAGIMAATRGRHPKVTICDDILSDFSDPLSSSDLLKINRIFRQAIMALPPNPTDPLLVVGTPQSYDDTLYSLANTKGWLWLMYPAIIDEKKKDVLWPEKYTFEYLKDIQQERGRTAFEVEYQLMPVKVLDQFFTREEILDVTDLNIMKWDLTKEFPRKGLSVFGGVDVGKLVHPSHVVIFVQLPNGTLVQVYEAFLDHMKYNTQVRVLNKLAKIFKISRGYYDATFNALDDRGLDRAWRGKVFTRGLKHSMATLFEKRVFALGDEPGIVLINDPRQLKQITVVDKQLKAATSVDGHGDAFWSIGLALQAAEDGPGITDIGSFTGRFSNKQFAPSQTWARQLGGVA